MDSGTAADAPAVSATGGSGVVAGADAGLGGGGTGGGGTGGGGGGADARTDAGLDGGTADAPAVSATGGSGMTAGGDAGGAGGVTDASGDVSRSGCDPLMPFGAPRLLQTLNEANGSTDSITISRDGLTAYLSSRRQGTQNYDIFTARRTSLTDDFGTPIPLVGLNSAEDDRLPVLSPDRLTLFFYRTSSAGEDIYVSTRPNLLADFSAPVVAGNVNLPDVDENTGSLTSDGRTFYLSSRRSGAFQIYRAAINLSGELQPPEEVGELNSGGITNGHPVVSADHLAVYFNRSNASGSSHDIMFARRSTVADGFGPATPVTELNSPFTELPDYLTPDGCTIYFTSNRGSSGVGGYELFSATRPMLARNF